MNKYYWLLLAISAVFVAVVVLLLIPSGFYKSIHPHFDGEIIQIYTEAHGTEDMEIDHDNELLFISSTNRRKTKTPSENGIYVLNLSDDNSRPRRLKSDYAKPMFFHGISLMHIDSITYLYAINHIQNDDFIELFKYRNDSLIFLKSFSDSLMISPNDIVGINTEEFYITNDHTTDDPDQDAKEDFLRFNNRNIIHCKNGAYREVANGLAMPNGINISSDGYILYCATTLSHELIAYNRDRATGSLEEFSRIDLGTGLDNIDIDPDGDIWIGAHPKILDFIDHAKDKENISPSQILKLIPLSTMGEYEVEEVYMDDGSTIPASSVGVRYGDELFIGDVFDNKILRARMN